jgi:hypothetical protein
MRRALALAILVATAAAAVAAEPVGKVLLAAGEVNVVRGGRTVALAVGDAVERGDEIRTGRTGNVQIRFNDTGIVALRADTAFAVDEFVFNGTLDGSESALFHLIKGGLRTVTGLIGKVHHERYGVVTPTSTIGIRGTHFNLVVCGSDCRNADGSVAPSGTYGGVLDGSIALTPNGNAGGERAFAKGAYFFAADAKSPAQKLLVPPAFVADKLESRRQPATGAAAVAAASGTSATTETGASSTGGGAAPVPGTDQGGSAPVSVASEVLAAPVTISADISAQPPTVPVAPLPTTPGDTPTPPIATAVLGTATGFIAQYVSTAGYFALDSCGNATGGCQGTSVSQFTVNQNELRSYANPPAANPQGTLLAGGSVVDGGSANLAGSNYSWGRWTGNFSVTDPTGTYTNLTSGVLFGCTDDPTANGGNRIFPTTGSVSYVLAGGPRPVDAEGNVGVVNSMSGTLDFVTRGVTFKADLSLTVPSQGSASLTLSGGGTVPANNDSLRGAALSTTCTGAACASANGSGLFDARFAGSAAQVMVVSGYANNAVKKSAGNGTNSVLFLNLLKCSAGC